MTIKRRLRRLTERIWDYFFPAPNRRIAQQAQPLPVRKQFGGNADLSL